jgi:hypothetical protein
MHTRIGAAGALRLHSMCRDLRQRRVDGILNSAMRGLSLPAAEAAAVILESKSDSHQNQKLAESSGEGQTLAAAR